MTRWSVGPSLIILLAACSTDPVDVDVEPIDCTNEVPCGPSATCQPFAGGHRCECDPGFGGDGTTCADVDECTAQTDDCVTLATCSNNDGGFVCTCAAGYQGDGRESGNGCSNANECDLGTDDCVSEATCSDTDGDYDCECPPTTHGDGRASGSGCVDDNECTLGTHDCVSLSTCMDAPGGYTCECDSGYTGDGLSSGSGCTDINECSQDIDDCLPAASCENDPGTYHCLCPSGFSGDGTISGSGCTDINECSLGTDDCVSVARCIDQDGTFDCECDPGYTGDGHGGGTGCDDIDECDAGTDDCESLATCVNEIPGYACNCDPGYTGDGLSNGTGCNDIDECTDGSDDCDANADCTNTPPGSFTCTCQSGWAGDGRACDPVGWHQVFPARDPGPRWWPAMAFFPGTGVVLYGGSATQVRDDSWLYDGTTWTEVCAPCDPGPRHGHNVVYDSANARLLMFGGSRTNDYTGVTNELWAGTAGGTWTLVSPGGTAPSPRWGASAAFDPLRGRVVLFGGQDVTGARSNEVFEYDGADWYGPFVPATAPEARDGAAVTYLAGTTFIYGGEGGSGFLDDFAAWDGSAWTVTPDFTARPRTGAQLFVNSGDVRIANGYDGDEIAGTWILDAVPMSVESATLPPARDSSALAFDPDRNVHILYGGNGGSCAGNCDETWEFYPFP